MLTGANFEVATTCVEAGAVLAILLFAAAPKLPELPLVLPMLEGEVGGAEAPVTESEPRLLVLPVFVTACGAGDAAPATTVAKPKLDSDALPKAASVMLEPAALVFALTALSERLPDPKVIAVFASVVAPPVVVMLPDVLKVMAPPVTVAFFVLVPVVMFREELLIGSVELSTSVPDDMLPLLLEFDAVTSSCTDFETPKDTLPLFVIVELALGNRIFPPIALIDTPPKAINGEVPLSVRLSFAVIVIVPLEYKSQLLIDGVIRTPGKSLSNSNGVSNEPRPMRLLGCKRDR